MKKNIVLIGGSKGIGLATAKLLSKDHNVHIISRTSEDLDSLNITHQKFDVTLNQISDLNFPDIIDGLVYFPGTINLKPFHMFKPEVFREDMELNFFSLVKIVQQLLPHLKRSEQASLVFFSTVAVKQECHFIQVLQRLKGL